MTSRIKWIDYGKGFTIFLVIFGHAILGSLQTQNYSGSSVTVLHYLLEIVYSVHIPVFFALSGYLFKPITGLKQLFFREKKRFFSLVVPYVFFSVIMVVLKMLGGNSVRNQNGIEGLLNIYWLPIDYLWFLYALFFVDLAVSIISLFLKNKYIGTVFYCGIFILNTYFKFTSPIISYVCLWAIFFYLGYFLRDINIPQWLGVTSVAIYIIHVPLFCFLYPKSYYLFGYWRIISVFAVFMMFFIFQKKQKIGEVFFEKCGQVSIELYLVHAPIISITRILLYKVGISSLWLQVPLQFFMGCVASFLVILLARRYSVIDFIFKPTNYLKADMASKTN